MQFDVTGPLNGHWLFPAHRDEGFTHDPEWNMDVESTYHFSIDDTFL